MRIRKILAIQAALLLVLTQLFLPAPARADLSKVAGRFNAATYAKWGGFIVSGNTATGTQTITVGIAGTLPDGRPYPAPYVGQNASVDVGSNNETVTLTGVSSATCPSGGTSGAACYNVTGSFNNLHGASQAIAFATSTGGLEEAHYDAFLNGGGVVTIDNSWTGTQANITAMLPFGNVAVEDTTGASLQYWTIAPSTTTALAAPTAPSQAAACTAATSGVVFCSDASVAGSASWGSTLYGCYTLVDIAGNESPCSSTVNFTSVASKAIDMGPPAAQTGQIVGWKPYLSVSGGSYALAYSVPLLTQPTVLLAIPVSAGVCTLTKLETVTPACAISNTTYGQSPSATGADTLFAKGGMQFTGYPVVTNTLAPEIGSASATAYNPNEEAHSTYAYAPSSRLGFPGAQSSHFAFPITAAAQTAVGEVEASFPLGPNFMNYAGRTIEVCGLIAKTSTTADTVDKIQLWWDAEGSNVTAGTPVELTSINVTEATALAAAANFHFCQQITTTVASASATGGTITPGIGYTTVSQVSAGANPSDGSSSLVAGVGSLNLALPAHLSVLLVHSTGTDGAGSILYGATLRVVN
jgi:hypothetical protein